MSLNFFFPSTLKSGIYLITCIPFNKHYVGLSATVTRRLNAHKSCLKRDCHPCAQLQEDYRRYGSENFMFQKLLLGAGLDKSKLEILETSILLTLPPERRYNVYTNWRKRPSELNPFFGQKHTEEARELISDAKKGKTSNFKGSKQTNKVKEFLSQQNYGTSAKERRKPLYIDGIYYESISQASEKTGLARRLIRERCHSNADRFQNYEWATKK